MPRRLAACCGRAGVSTAPGASAQEVNIIILYLKFVRIDVWPGQTVKAWIFDINDLPAIQAHQMMMLTEPGIKSRRRARVTGLGHQPERNERAQDAMDRHAGDLRQLAANLAEKLLRRRMVGSVQDRFKHGASLRRDRQPALAVRGEEPVHSLLFVGRTHLSEMNNLTKR